MTDWKQESYYPLDLPLEGWAWEFLRRNPAYQADYEQWSELIPYVTAKYSHSSFPTLRALQADRKIMVYDPPRGRNESLNQWRMRCINAGVDPQSLRQDEWLSRKWQLERLIDPNLAYGRKIRFRKLTFPTEVHWDDVDNYFITPREPGAPEPVPDPRHPLLAFDLARRLKPQLARAQKLLVASGKANKAKSPKLLPKEWQRQLRVLDARRAKVSLKEIAKVLFPHKDPDAGAKNVDDVYRAAQMMVTTGYRKLLE